MNNGTIKTHVRFRQSGRIKMCIRDRLRRDPLSLYVAYCRDLYWLYCGAGYNHPDDPRASADDAGLLSVGRVLYLGFVAGQGRKLLCLGADEFIVFFWITFDQTSGI